MFSALTLVCLWSGRAFLLHQQWIGSIVNLLGIAGTAVVLFASTNVDALLMLVMFFSSGRFHPRSIVAGEFLGAAVVVAASLLCAAASILIPASDLAWLGLMPLGLGVWQLFRAPDMDASVDRPLARHGRDVLVIAMITLSHSADNVAAYVPYFATTHWHERLLVVGIFAVMMGVWCWLARALLRHPLAAASVQRVGRWLTPLVLIALGMWILAGLMHHG
jgi:cadmium resistance protein CadD (predicted permease)